MSDGTKQTNRVLIEHISTDLGKLVKDMFIIKNEIRVICDKLNIIQTQALKAPAAAPAAAAPAEEEYSGWRIF